MKTKNFLTTIIFLIGITISSFAQSVNCSLYTKANYDAMEDYYYITGLKNIIASDDYGETGLLISMMKWQKTIILNVYAVGASSCIDRDSKIIFLLEDNSIITFYNKEDFNCKKKTTIYIGEDWNNINSQNKLCNSYVKTIRVWTEEGYVERNIDKENQILFMNTMKCLSN